MQPRPKIRVRPILALGFEKAETFCEALANCNNLSFAEVRITTGTWQAVILTQPSCIIALADCVNLGSGTSGRFLLLDFACRCEYYRPLLVCWRLAAVAPSQADRH